MAEISPFKGLLYNQKKIKDIYSVVAPPYDVIKEEERTRLADRDQHNVVRLILSRDDSVSGENRYQVAAGTLSKWIDEGVLARDETPALYYYQQTYKLKDGSAKTRKGLVTLLKLEEFEKGIVLPHERTLSKPKADRLNLMSACNAHLSCVFALYSDPTKTIDGAILKGEREALFELTDDNGIENKFERVDDDNVLGEVVKEMAGKSLLIADGHHRYETALNYRNMMRKKYPDYKGDEAFNYVLVCLTNMDDEGLTVFPTHRLLYGLDRFTLDSFLSELSQYFDIEETVFNEELEKEKRELFFQRLKDKANEGTGFGLYVKGKNSYYALILKDNQTMNEWVVGDLPLDLKALDLNVLHSLIIKGILGVDEGMQERQECIDYSKDADDTIESVKKDKYQLAFILNTPQIGKIKAIAEAGERMPQKSTFFYPKLLSGLVINLIQPEEKLADNDRVSQNSGHNPKPAINV